MASGALRFKNSVEVRGGITLEESRVSLVLTGGTTEDRPAVPVFGMIRANTTSGRIEFYQDDNWQEFVHRTGDSLTSLTITAAPVAPTDAVNREYVDARLADYSAGAYLRLIGGTLSGVLTLAGDPANPLEAVTKQYTDAGDAAVLSAAAAAASGRVSRSGDTMTGLLVLSGPPVSHLHAATKAYVDTQIASTTPDLSSRVARSGDTMLGALILHADPSLPLHAATKQYTDAADAVVLAAANAAASAAASKLPLAGGTLTGPLTLEGDPTAPLHAATRAYVDANAQGLDIKEAVRTASSSNITLASPGASIGGLTLLSGDRVLLIGQTNPVENGIWVFSSAAAPLTRAPDADTNSEVKSGLFAFVADGAQSGNGYVLTTSGTITLGTTPLTFTQFSGAGQIIAGLGLSRDGNSLAVVAGTGITVAADAVALSGQALALHQLASNGLIARIAAGQVAGRVITGTTARVTVTNGDAIAGNPQVDIHSAYPGQTSITTVGTIATGTWAGTPVDVAHGGTGATTPAAARSALQAAAVNSPTFTGTVTLPGGTSTNAGLKFTIGAPLATPVVGAVEFDGETVQVTVDQAGVPTRKTLVYAPGTNPVLGSMATQNFNSVVITGGTITNTEIDATALDGGDF